MRSPTLLLGSSLVLLAVLAAAPSSASVEHQATVFTSVDGVFVGHLSFSSPCPGPATATLTLTALDGSTQVRTVDGWNVGLPSPCDWACTGCSMPVDWVFEGDDGVTLLAGGGIMGQADAWSLQGAWQEGFLESATGGASCERLCTIDWS